MYGILPRHKEYLNPGSAGAILDIYCHPGMQRLRDVPGAYEYDTLSECLKFSIRQAKPLSVENLYSKNKNFMTE